LARVTAEPETVPASSSPAPNANAASTVASTKAADTAEDGALKFLVGDDGVIYVAFDKRGQVLGAGFIEQVYKRPSWLDKVRNWISW
jgi:hypothetical protein